MTVSIFDPKREHKSIKAEIDQVVLRVLGSGWYLLGPELEEFEKEFIDWLGGVKFAVGVHSGTDALRLSLRALGVGPGDEVITTPMTAVYTAYAISSVGALPVLADIDKTDLNISPNEIEKSITERTKAIIPVHLHGFPCDMSEIMRIARDDNLKVIEDCAQAQGATIEDRKVGTFGEVGCFSFYPTKNLGAYGDGGMVVTRNMNLSAKIRLLRVGGFSNGASYIHEQISIHSRLDELQSAILRVKLKHLDEWTARRCAVAEVYNERLSKLPITLPPRDDNKKHVYHQYVIRTDKRDELFRHFMRRDIGCKVHYKTPVHLQPAYSHLGLEEGAFPNAENAAKEMLSLPINPFLTESEVEKVCEVIEEFYK